MQQKDQNLSKNIIWNTVGSLFLLACHWLITVLVVRLANGTYFDAGLLSLAMSVTNVFSIIALFNVRNYQVSDTVNLYSSGEYVTHRLLTCSLAFALCLIVTLIGDYPLYTGACILVYLLLKLVENFADVLHGIAQKSWRLDVAGKSSVLRGVLLVTSFAIVYPLTQNLLLALLCMTLTTLLSLLLYDLNVIGRIERFSVSVAPGRMLKLSAICLPMVGYGFFVQSVSPFVKSVLERCYGEEQLGYYGSVTTIAVLVQSVTVMIFTPLVGIFDQAHRQGDRRKMRRLLLMVLFVLVGVTLLALLAVALLGEFAMVLLFGEEIRIYVYLLYPTIVASCLTALVWLMGMILVVIRDTKTLLLGSLVGWLIGVAMTLVLVPKTGFWGANASQIVPFAWIAVIYLLRFVVYLFSPSKSTLPQEGNVCKERDRT